ncbi:MAG: sialidase family protein [Bacteriovoracaceae bacterium]|nr:sialidase family protein [Bacteriovoracaceae bacterium]
MSRSFFHIYSLTISLFFSSCDGQLGSLLNIAPTKTSNSAIASWKASLPLEFTSSSSFTSSRPKSVINSSGHILIAWEQSDGINYQIYYSYFDGSSWVHPSNLNDNISPDGQDVTWSRIAMNNDGKIVITWQQSSGEYNHVFYSYFNGTSWDHPSSLSDYISPNGKNAFYPQVDMNNEGKIVITWQQHDGSYNQIFYSYFDGTSWDHPSSLTDNISPDGQNATSPKVAMNSDGEIVISWPQYSGGRLQIFYSYFNGSSWVHPSGLSDNISPDGYDAYNLQIAMNNDGKIVITWQQYDGSNIQIYYSYFDGTIWDHPSSLSDNISPDGQNAYNPQAVINSAGKIVITWQQNDGVSFQIFYSYFDGTSWDHSSGLSDNISPDGQDCSSAQVAINNDGKIIITWYQSDGSNNQIFYSYFDGTSWDHPSGLSDNISPDGQYAYYPQTDINSDGKMVITWQQFDGSSSQIFYSYFDGSSWVHPSSLSDNISADGQNANGPQMAMNSDGKIVISWQQFDGTDYQIYYSYFDGSNWHHPSSLSDNISNDGQYSYSPQVAINDDGKIIITWYQSDGTNYQIFYSYYDGTSWDHPSGLSDNISPDGQEAISPQVVMNNDGKILITWYQNDGSNFQIFYSYFNGTSWDHPSSLSDNISPDGQESYSPKVAINNDGKIVIAWLQNDGTNDQLFYSYFNGTIWVNPVDLNDNISPDGQYSLYHQVAINNNGLIVITWEQSDGSNTQFFMSYFDGTSWHHPSSLSDNISPDGQEVNLNDDIGRYAKISMNDSNEIIITWAQHDGQNFQVFHSSYAGSSWTHPSSTSDFSLPSGATGCTFPIPLMTSSYKKIMMTCLYDGKNRLYELDSANQFAAGSASDYLSLENETVFSLSGKMVSDTLGVLTYQSTYNSPSIGQIRYVLWNDN